MHESFFNYAVRRPYPYRWFTPVALFGGVVLLVLLSVMNFVQNSYTLTVEYASDPNSTIINGVWFENWPSYLTSSVRPTCQPANLPVNTQFFTNQSALMWTLTSVFKDKDSSDALPSLPYMNNLLESCNVTSVQMEFDDSSLTLQQQATWNIQVRAFATCRIQGASGYSIFNVTAMYDGVTPYTVPGSTVFVARDSTNRSSIFWGEALLSGYWANAVTSVWGVAAEMKANATVSKGVSTLYPNEDQEDIKSLDFFKIGYYFLPEWKMNNVPPLPGLQDPLNATFTNPPRTIEHYINLGVVPETTPYIWRQVDSLAKSMYSAAVTDLGRISLPSKSNILASAATLQNFSSEFASIAETTNFFSLSQLESKSYKEKQTSSNPTGPLTLTPSVISTNYLCQVPRRKPIGDIFIAVLLADLVLLQAAWKLYTYSVYLLFLRGRPTAMHCKRCVEREALKDKMDRNDMAKTQKTLKTPHVAYSVSIFSNDDDNGAQPSVVKQVWQRLRLK